MLPRNRIYRGPDYRIHVLLITLILIVAVPCHADLRSGPAWFDTNGPGAAPDWHYRVPIAIPANTAAASTIRVDVDFNAFMSALGISGTFDAASPRIVRNNGSLAATQQFTDAVYMGGSDAMSNGRGEVRFISQDIGPATYYLYFDITQNGAKSAWPVANTINGNFEFGTTGQTAPAGWTATANAGFDAQLRPGETPSISSDTTGADTPFVTTDGTPHTGQFSYMLGSRSQNEPGNADPAVTLSRTFTVASANPGDLNLRYRLEGWDSSADSAGQYDFIRIRLVGSTAVEMVGPGAGNYGIFPFSPNYGTTAVSGTQSGYGRYNGWDTDTGGSHHYSPPMTLAQGSQPWFQVSANLNAFAGQTITLEITSSHYNSYRSWAHVDDVQWSVVGGTLGSPEAFGTNVTLPTTAVAGSILSIAATVDAQPSMVRADLLDDSAATVATGIVLFDDGSHGDLVAGDGQWVNDGSDAGSPTYTIPPGATIGSSWSMTVFALDASASTIAATDGLVHIPGQPGAPESPLNFFNIDTHAFSIVIPAPDLSTSTKSVLDVNGGPLYPGDTLRYTISLIESAGVPATGARVTDVIPAHVSGFTLVSMPAGATDASTPHGSGPNGTGYLDITGIDLSAGGSATVVFDVSVAANATTGAVIDNTAVITVAGGTGANPAVASPPVAAIPAGGNKQLYLATTTTLSRMPPAAASFVRIGRNSNNAWALSPQLQQPLIINGGSGLIPLVLMLRKNGSNSSYRTMTLDLSLDSIGTTALNIGSLSGQNVSVNNSVQLFSFMIPISGNVILDAGSAIVLTLSNTSSANRTIRVYTTSGGNDSQLQLQADTVINVDSVAWYDAAYPGGSVVTSTEPGTTVYIRASVSDPFGSFDITGASVNLSGPLGSTNDPMALVHDSGTAFKIYEHSLALPAFGSDGTWTAVVTAAEGTEGTITHQGTAALNVGTPQLTVLKSANRATASPGDLIIYTIQVVNAGSAPAINIELDDAMSPYTALRIAYDGIDPLPFRLAGAPGGLVLGTPVYSDDGGATYGYAPLVSGGNGVPAGHDGNVSHWRLPMNGTLNGNGTGFTVRYQVVVK